MNSEIIPRLEQRRREMTEQKVKLDDTGVKPRLRQYKKIDCAEHVGFDRSLCSPETPARPQAAARHELE